MRPATTQLASELDQTRKSIRVSTVPFLLPASFSCSGCGPACFVRCKRTAVEQAGTAAERGAAHKGHAEAEEAGCSVRAASGLGGRSVVLHSAGAAAVLADRPRCASQPAQRQRRRHAATATRKRGRRRRAALHGAIATTAQCGVGFHRMLTSAVRLLVCAVRTAPLPSLPLRSARRCTLHSSRESQP
jgi:hypothetical protein